MKPNKLITLTASLLLFAGGAGAASLYWTGQDVGSPQLAGSVTPGAGGTFTIVGGGDDIWNNSIIATTITRGHQDSSGMLMSGCRTCKALTTGPSAS